MVNLGIQFDVIGLSVYPATTTNWIADTTNAQNNLLYCANRYGKEVDVSETGMNVNAAQACENMLVDLMNRTQSVPNHKGLGLFYWEPVTAYWGQGAYLFSGKVGSPTVAMDAFLFSPNPPPASPVLSGSIVGGQLQLAWAAGASNYSTYLASNLVPAHWQLVTNKPQTSNGMYYLSLPTTNRIQQFFRLSNP
jgi:hypothetical protein